MVAVGDLGSMVQGDGDLAAAVVDPEATSVPPHRSRGFDLTEDLGPMLNAVFWVLVGLAFLFLALRIYCKFQGGRSTLWWDDWILIASWIMFLIVGILTSVVINLGYGKHIFAVDPSTLPSLGIIGYVSSTSSVLAAAWSKTSVAITMLRLTTDWSKWVIWFMIVTMNIAMTLSAIYPYISCKPTKRAWDLSVGGTCWPLKVLMKYGLFAGIYSGIMDVALALFALKVVAGLQMKLKEKIGVAIAMCMGILAGVAAFIRVSYFRTLSSGDFTYYGSTLVIWGAVEICITIIAACIPVLRVLIRDAQTKLTMRYNRATMGTTGSTAISTTTSRQNKTAPCNITVTAVSAGDDII